MSFFLLIFALILGYHRPESQPDWLRDLTRPYAAWLEHNFNDGRKRHGTLAWVIAVSVPVLIAGIVTYALSGLNESLGAVFSLLVLYLALRVGRFGHMPERIAKKLRADQLPEARDLLVEWQGGDALNYDATHIAKAGMERALQNAHYEIFAPIFWFFIFSVVGLGAAGVLLYRLSWLLKNEWNGAQGDFGKFPTRVFNWLDWLPARVTAAGFAVVGDFEDAVYCWRTQAADWPDEAQGIILASGAGALGVRLGNPLPTQDAPEYRPELGMGDEPDADYLQSATGLIWRVLVVMLGLMLLLSFAHWLGS
ncbi:MAG: CobD/CbiB family protein [Methylobacillus sp.]|nr:CobD/CbiB family protein [Methylobacillus sp.]